MQSFQKAKISGLKVGLAVNPPFVQNRKGQYSGTEVKLIQDFARRHNLSLHYTLASESQLIAQLEAYQLHVVAGGFDTKTIWISKAGLSVPYDQEHVLLVPKGENELLHKLEQHIFESQ